ncbi:MAG: circularly permuted type 2 ATP-grasp protein [Verrucomicrobiota bacterium]
MNLPQHPALTPGPAAAAPLRPWSELVSGYVPPEGHYDEMVSPVRLDEQANGVASPEQGMLFSGSVRAPWRRFLESVSQFNGETMSRRWNNARHLIRENGITYNVYGDAHGLDRTWQLDPIPFILPPEEWRQLEAGLVQRATLLNEILVDCYGPARLLRNGAVPAGAVYAHRRFLRPCVDVKVPDNRFLQLYAVDLARHPDGTWCVLNDRTQAPSGVGYALENRLVLSRMMPEVMHACGVERLANFATKLRESLEQLAPREDNPRIVLLTPGPYNETYFEHAYLARFLGCILAEGADLTVRDNKVYLKTLNGLLKVDVILRRLDEDYCDPLEFRSTSALGVAGLMQCVAAGEVAMANALGSGLAENPALHPFLPSLCRDVLDQELLLPTVPTWWCGQAQERHFVLEHLNELSVQPITGNQRFQLFTEPDASPEALDELAREIELSGYTYTGHERFPLATTPTLSEGALAPRIHVLRCFLIAHDGGYTMMPGGLTRVSSGPEPGSVSMQRGAGSKDTWFLSDGPPTGETLVKMEPPGFAVLRSGEDLPSRVADNLFWLGRYTDRLESVVRIFRTVLARLTDESALRHMPGLMPLLEVPAGLGLFRPPREDFNPEDPATFNQLERDLIRAIFESSGAGTLGDTVNRLHQTASAVRDRISPDLWRILNHLHQEVQTPEARPGMMVGETINLLDQMVLTLAAFSGMEMENMTRGHDWRFIELGRRLERAVNLTRLLRAALEWRHRNEEVVLESLLEMADSSMTYRTRYFDTARPKGVIDLLVTDETNPRSLSFQLEEIAGHLQKLPRPAGTEGPSEEELLIRASATALAGAPVEALAEVSPPDGHRARLGGLLDDLSQVLPRLSELLTRHYFSHM